MRCTSSWSGTLPRPYEFSGNAITRTNQPTVSGGWKQAKPSGGAVDLPAPPLTRCELSRCCHP